MHVLHHLGFALLQLQVLDTGPDGQPAHTEESMIRAEAGFAR